MNSSSSTCSFSGYRPLLSAVIDRLSLAALAVIDCLPVCSSFGGYRPLLVVIDRFFQRWLTASSFSGYPPLSGNRPLLSACSISGYRPLLSAVIDRIAHRTCCCCRFCCSSSTVGFNFHEESISSMHVFCHQAHFLSFSTDKRGSWNKQLLPIIVSKAVVEYLVMDRPNNILD